MTALACPAGLPDADYSCHFCRVRVHRGDGGCPCSTTRQAASFLAPICLPCAAAVDQLSDRTTRLGEVHAAIVREATFTFASCDD